ncbi:MAG TPA: tRNA (adenosine(37)-N6)-threonylcarbamoyltransferase complex ATPase subunit type 1 TsaE, partial [Solirubrobacteraceae bacterium]|nr:tRNA (adenosine(37)-N6)-threonylcarbamoyltransferase complex ATPase subunit type 1 TsaE [Solirubrobacteraceae bacterium]
TVSHIDLYRLASLDGEDPDLLAPYLGAGRIAFVEWPQAAAEALGTPRLSIDIRHAGGDRREIEVLRS